MKEIMREYGGAIISATAAVLLFTLIFVNVKFKNQIGLFHVIRDTVSETDGEKDKNIKSLAVSESRIKSGTPDVRAGDDLEADKNYRPEDLIRSADGTDINVRILKVSDMNGRDITDEVILKADGESNCRFSDEGIYRIRFYVEDNDLRSGTEELYIGVKQ